MKRCAAGVLLGLFSSACGGDGTRVAVEPNSDADLRILLTASSGGTKNIVALTRDEAFRLPIEDVARGKATLKVAVVAYDRARLDAAFPTLSRLDLPALKAALRPAFGAPGAGAYAPPPPLRALRADVSGEKARDVAYAEVALESVLAEPELAFVFPLSGALACAPGAGRLRAFSRDRVARACTFERNDACAWEAESACPDAEAIFGRALDADTTFREVPGALRIEPSGISCPALAAAELQSGESNAFACPGSSGPQIVAIQETPRLEAGGTWHLVPQADSVVLRHARPLAVRTGDQAAFLALQNGNRIQLDRLAIEGGQDEQNPILDAVSRGELTILLQGQALLGLSSNPPSPYIAIDVGARAFVLESRPQIGMGALTHTYYVDALADGIPAPANVRGPLTVGSGTTLYWPITSGLALYDARDLTAPPTTTPAGTVTLPGSDRVASSFDRITERVTLWTTGGEVFVFDQAGSVRLSGCNVGGRVLAALPRQQVIVERDPFVLEIFDLPSEGSSSACAGLAPTRRIAVPPLAGLPEGTRLELDATSFLAGARDKLIFRCGALGGVLDLASGLSQMSPLAAPASTSIFIRDAAGDEWALFPPSLGTTVELFAVPTAAPLLGR